MSCKICGNPLNSDERFCSICGAENEDAKTPVETGEIIPNPPSDEEGGFQIDDSEFVWNIYEFPRPRKTDEVDFTWSGKAEEAPQAESVAESQGTEEAGAQEQAEPVVSAPPETESASEQAPIYVNIYRSNESDKKKKDSTYRASELVFELADEPVETTPEEEAAEASVSDKKDEEKTTFSPPHQEAPLVETPVPVAGEASVRITSEPVKTKREEPLSDEERAKAIDDLYLYEEEDNAGEDYESLEAFLFGHDAFRSIAAKQSRKRRETAPPAGETAALGRQPATEKNPAAERPPARAFVAGQETGNSKSSGEAIGKNQHGAPEEEPAPFAGQATESAPGPADSETAQVQAGPQLHSGFQAEPAVRQEPRANPEPAGNLVPPAVNSGAAEQAPLTDFEPARHQKPSAGLSPAAEQPPAAGAVPPANAAEEKSVPKPEAVIPEVVMVERSEPSWPEGVTFVPESRPGMEWHTFRSLADWEEETARMGMSPKPEETAEAEAPLEIKLQSGLPKAFSPSVTAKQQPAGTEEPTEPEDPIQPVRVSVEKEEGIDIEDVKRDIDPTLNSDVFTKDLTKTKPYARSAFHGKLFTNGKPESDPFIKLKQEEPAAVNVQQEPAGQPQPANPVRSSLESDLFQEIAADAKNRDDEVEKFFTFSKKNEEFQRLLDKEYEKIKKLNADKPLAEIAPSHHNDSAASPLLNTFESEPRKLEGFLSKEEDEEKHNKANHLSEMAKAREAFFSTLDEGSREEEDKSVHKKIKLRSKGPSEVHVTVEVKGSEISDLTENAQPDVHAEKEAALEDDEFLASLFNSKAETAIKGEGTERSGAKEKTSLEKIVPPDKNSAAEVAGKLAEVAGKLEPEPVKPVNAEMTKPEQAKQTVPAYGSEPPAVQPIAAKPAGETTAVKPTAAKPEVKQEVKEKPEEKDQDAFNETLDAIWKAQEVEEEEEKQKAGKKASPLATVVLVIIAIVLVVEIAALGIKTFMPGTVAEQFVTSTQVKIVQAAGNLGKTVTGFFNKEEQEPEPDPDEPDDVTEPGEVDEGDALDIAPVADKTLLIQSQYMSNYNANIKELIGDDSLAYSETAAYSRPEIHETEPITNNILRVDAEAGTMYCDASVAAAIVAYNSRWVAYANSGDDSIFGAVIDASPAYTFLRSYNKVGKVEKIFHSLALGDIRQGNDGYYAWVREVIETVENGATVTNTTESIYRVEEDADGYMKVTEQIALQ